MLCAEQEHDESDANRLCNTVPVLVVPVVASVVLPCFSPEYRVPMEPSEMVFCDDLAVYGLVGVGSNRVCFRLDRA